jgi:hypothetical protein
MTLSITVFGAVMQIDIMLSVAILSAIVFSAVMLSAFTLRRYTYCYAECLCAEFHGTIFIFAFA